jgi:potassium efflux system protein
MRALRALTQCVVIAAIWPLYLVLLAYVARVGPWPKSPGILASAILSGVAIALFVHDAIRWLTMPAGVIVQILGVPENVSREIGRCGRFLAISAAALLLPAYLFDHGLIAPEGRPLSAPAIVRLLAVGFELCVLSTSIWLARRSSPVLEWIASYRPGGADAPRSTRVQKVFNWLARHRRMVAALLVLAVAGVILLDVRGYSFTARRLAAGGTESLVAILLALALQRGLAPAVAAHYWRWVRPNRSWALALTSRVVTRAARTRSRAGRLAPAAVTADSTETPDVSVRQEDLEQGLRRISAVALSGATVLALACIWDLDLALLRFLLGQSVWPDSSVTLGNTLAAAIIGVAGGILWRSLNALFALLVFPRMPDDPGVRFAVVTLCRYAVLGLTAMGILGALHVDLAKISVVLAALGVGLGFGLQEIVSNFVCGIILLLERPIRIGDTVTVAGNTGKVDRINIRATTILNSDNQSMIVPNREFITGNLVNWTHKDRILRVGIKVGVAYGTDPDRVVELLLEIARADPDVVALPEPGASLEGFGESSLQFSLSAFVPDPGLAGSVRHRLCSSIQRRFAREKILIPYPTQEFHIGRVPREIADALFATGPEFDQTRIDAGERVPPSPHTSPAARRGAVPPFSYVEAQSPHESD